MNSLKALLFITMINMVNARYGSMFRGRRRPKRHDSNDVKISQTKPKCACPFRPYQHFVYIPNSDAR